jgi:HEAT repeat protein
MEDVVPNLRHGDGRVRRAAVRAVWKLGGPRSASALLAVFPGTDPETQLEILFGLAQIQSAAAVPVLGEFTRSSQTSEKLRMKSIETLGQIGQTVKPCKGGTESVDSSSCLAPSGLDFHACFSPGFQSPLRVLFHPLLLRSSGARFHWTKIAHAENNIGANHNRDGCYPCGNVLA